MFGCLTPFQLWVQNWLCHLPSQCTSPPWDKCQPKPFYFTFQDQLPSLSSSQLFLCSTPHQPANTSELYGLRKFHHYIPCILCQDVKILSKTSPRSAPDEFHNKTVNHISCSFHTCTHSSALFTRSSSVVNTSKEAVPLLSSVILQPLTVIVHCLFLDHSLPPSAPLISLNRTGMVYCKNMPLFPMYFEGTPSNFWLKLTGKKKLLCFASARERAWAVIPTGNWWAASHTSPQAKQSQTN